MIDWDTVRLAPGTRNLDHRRTSAIRPNHRPAASFRTVDFYRLGWDLADL